MRRRVLVAVATLGLVAARGLAGGGPDLAVDAERLAASVVTDVRVFAPDACVLQPADLCVTAPGARKLLRFDVLARNLGDADLVVGRPDPDDRLPNGDPKWTFSTCPDHDHWHFETFARYDLLVPGGEEIAAGLKRAFCLRDSIAGDGQGGPPRYCCGETEQCEHAGVQGISAGWGDLYSAALDCQWIDVTDVPPGDYQLRVRLNTAGVLPDADPTNDVAVVPVTLTGPSDAEPAPDVRVRPLRRDRVRAGRRMLVRWKTKMPGTGALRFHEVWYSLDDGGSWTLVTAGLPPTRRRHRWSVPAGVISDTARLRVVAWTDAGHRAEAVSRPFRVVAD